MLNLSIKGISHYIPKGRMTNDEAVNRFTEYIGDKLSNEECRELREGYKRKLEFLEIKTRAYCENYNDENSIYMATVASKQAIKKAMLEVEDIDLILFVGVCNPFREPSYAIIIANELGVKDANYYDIGDACNGFLKSIEIASLYIEKPEYENILIVTSESTHEMIDALKKNISVNGIEEADYKTNLLFAGNGAAAMILSSESEGRKIKYYGEKRDCTDWDISFFVSPKIKLPSKRFDEMDFVSYGDGRAIAGKVIKEMPEFVFEFLKKNDIDKDSIKYIFSHQLGRNITNSILNKMEVDIDKVFPLNTFIEYGNMGSANIPVGLSIAEENGLIQKGDAILLLGSSCGLTYSAAYIIW